jgi:serine/threonine protein kinase
MAVGDLPFTSPNVRELHEFACNGDYEIPEDLSPECRDLIDHLLRVNPKKRFTIRDIKEHVWFTEGLNIIGLDRSKNVKNMTVPLKESDLNMKIIEEMEQVNGSSLIYQFGIKRETIIKSIVECTFDEWCGTYNIMVFQKTHEAVTNSTTSEKVKQDKTKASAFQPPKSVLEDFDEDQQKIIKQKITAITASKAIKAPSAKSSNTPSRKSTTIRKPSVKRNPPVESEDIDNFNGDNLARVLMNVNNGFDEDEKKASSASSSSSRTKTDAKTPAKALTKPSDGLTRATAAYKSSSPDAASPAIVKRKGAIETKKGVPAIAGTGPGKAKNI